MKFSFQLINQIYNFSHQIDTLSNKSSRCSKLFSLWRNGAIIIVTNKFPSFSSGSALTITSFLVLYFVQGVRYHAQLVRVYYITGSLSLIFSLLSINKKLLRIKTQLAMWNSSISSCVNAEIIHLYDRNDIFHFYGAFFCVFIRRVWIRSSNFIFDLIRLSSAFQIKLDIFI